MPEDSKNKKYGKYFQESSSAVSIGLNMAVGIAFFTWIGYIIDQKRGGGQAFTLGGMFLGLFYGGYEIWKVIRQTNK